MLTQKEVEEAISEFEKQPSSNLRTCEKLAALYTVYDHLFAPDEKTRSFSDEERISLHGDSDFLKAVRGKEAYSVWIVLDELMQTLRALDPKLYNAVMEKIEYL